jgi:CheY-like chemotaxis protein
VDIAMTTKIPACYFPTTAILVDDQRSALEKLQRGLNDSLATYRISTKPQEALDHLNAIHSNPKKWVSLQEDGIMITNLNEIAEELFNLNRFNYVSAVVVDYDMPEMTGLEFCQKIKSPHVQKILLTGVADEKLAIKAFNEGGINYYIRKHDPDVFNLLETYIAESQQRYFKTLTQSLIESATLDSSSTALDEPIFTDFFLNFIKENRISEYYLMQTSGSFLCINHEGKISALFVFTDEMLRAHDVDMDYLIDLNSEKKVLEASVVSDLLHRRKAFSFNFFNKDSFPESDKWHKHINPLRYLEEGRQRYYWTYVPDFTFAGEEKVAHFKEFRARNEVVSPA